MSRLWLDVTTLLGWEQRAVGIVRVEAECAAYLLRGPLGDAAFCRFEAGRYLPVEAGDVQAALDRVAGGLAQPEAKAAVAQAGRPAPAPPPLPRTATGAPSARQRAPAVAAALDGLAHLREALRRVLRPRPAGFPRPLARATDYPSSHHPFSAGDVYLSLGLDWDQKDLSLVRALKQRVGLRVVLMCYDLIPVKFPHLCVHRVARIFPDYIAEMAACADEILCISECTRRDLLAHLKGWGLGAPATKVVPLGCQLPGPEAAQPGPVVQALLGQRFILFVSTIERRKNHEVLYRAWARMAEAGVPDLPILVFTGAVGWDVGELLADIELDERVRGRIRMLQGVTDGELALLYRESLFTVYPSLYEGWGLPVAESLAAGKFCLVSSAASLPEVGGDLVEYLDPLDLQAWISRIRWYCEHPHELAARELAIREGYKARVWEDAARAMLGRGLGLLGPDGGQDSGRSL